MGLRTAAEAEARRRGGTCTFQAIYAQLSKKDAAELRELLAGDMPSTQIARALKTHAALQVSVSTVNRHRIGECACGSL